MVKLTFKVDEEELKQDEEKEIEIQKKVNIEIEKFKNEK
jgi:hypothetical protein